VNAAKEEAGSVNWRAVAGITATATLGGFLFGFDSGVINGTVDGLQSAFASDSIGTGFSVASMLLGCAVGAFFAARLSDRFGRRAIMFVAAIFFIISAWGSGISTGVTEFVIYRVLGGLAVGAASVLAPAYISEVTPPAMRGRLSSVQQVMIIVGLTAAFLSNYWLAGSAGLSTAEFWLGFEAWRWMFWAEILPATIFLVALFFIPESPRYLALRGRDAEASAVIAWLGSIASLQAVKDSLAKDHAPKFADLLDGGRLRPLVWAGIGLAVFQQLVGINVVFYYGAVLWQSVGFSESDALAINVLTGGVSIGAVFAAIALIDRIGRKPLLMIGSIGMAVTLAAMALAFSTGTFDADGNLALTDSWGVTALVAANLYVAFFNFSWGPVMWVMLGEMFPNQMRGSGLAVSGFAQWIANFGITMTFPLLLAGVGLAVTYSFYAACAALSALFVAALIAETRGKSLEEMSA